MHKMNFEQTAPAGHDVVLLVTASRDVGGPSGVVLLVTAIALCAVWGLMLHVSL
jgi:hypothetical protein